MCRCRLVPLLALLIAGAIRGAHAQEPTSTPAAGPRIDVDAEQINYDQKTDTVTARGNVVIRREDTELRAQEVTLRRSSSEASASGDVHLSNPDVSLTAAAGQLDLEDETGTLEDAQIEAPRLGYSISGQRLTKGLGQSYHIENGRFTTCRCSEGPQSWTLEAKELDVTLGGYGKLRGGTFNVLDVPVMYLPRGIFPANRERESGFLIPRFGLSNRRGFQTLLPFYWAISKSQDATLAFDVETSARAGLTAEYRYSLSRDLHGVLSGSYFNESFRGQKEGRSENSTIPENRWNGVAEHEHDLGDHVKLYVDSFIVSDDLFPREINTYALNHTYETKVRTLPYTESRGGAVGEWDRVLAKGSATYYQDLTGGDSQTLQRVPDVGVWGQTLLGQMFMGDLAAEAVDFQRGTGFDGLRGDIEPRVMLPLPLGRYVFGSVAASVRETAYHLTNENPLEPGLGSAALDRNESRELFQANGHVGTLFSRIYPFRRWGLIKLKHTIEPGFEYLYVPTVGQEDLPLFDGVDRVNRRNLISYGFVTRLVGKFASATDSDGDAKTQGGEVRELARFSAIQSYDVSREIDPLQEGRAADHFSDIDFAGRINPNRFLSLRFETNYDTSNTDISAANVGLFVEDPRGQSPTPDGEQPRLETRTSAGVSYRVLTQNLLQEIDSNVVIRVTDWAGLLYASRYDIAGKRLLDNHFGLRLISQCDCWALDVTVTDKSNPNEVEARVQLTLVGLGSDRSHTRVAEMP